MDTDSLIYTIQSEDFYTNIRPDIDIFFKMFDYPSDNAFEIPQKNKKVLGMMKDQNCG